MLKEIPRATDMKIVEVFPPNINEINNALGDCSKSKPVYCYGSTIYNPYKRVITPDVEIHEQVHSRQQGQFPEIWWEQYFVDKEFRLNQEIEAYGTQYDYVLKHIEQGKLRRWMLEKLSMELSGSAYGNLISYAKAESRIRSFTKNNSVLE